MIDFVVDFRKNPIKHKNSGNVMQNYVKSYHFSIIKLALLCDAP